MSNPEESVAVLEQALDSGIYHWDTGHDYVYGDVISEECFGLVLESRRDEVFLATKVGDRTYDGAMRHLEESLQRLKTDHLDLHQIHNVRSVMDVDTIGTEGGVLQAMYELRDQGVTRYIGFTGHSSAEGLPRWSEDTTSTPCSTRSIINRRARIEKACRCSRPRTGTWASWS